VCPPSDASRGMPSRVRLRASRMFDFLRTSGATRARSRLRCWWLIAQLGRREMRRSERAGRRSRSATRSAELRMTRTVQLTRSSSDTAILAARPACGVRRSSDRALVESPLTSHEGEAATARPRSSSRPPLDAARLSVCR